MANAVRSPRRLFRPHETHASTHAARARARRASFVAHITWICRAFTGVQVSLSTPSTLEPFDMASPPQKFEPLEHLEPLSMAAPAGKWELTSFLG